HQQKGMISLSPPTICNSAFWCRGYYVDTVGKNTAKIQDYIKHQLEEDKMGEQLSIPYPGSPFTGRK
ncbi:transposase, partial [Escherichia coli]|uniref:transposase n=2 Tax=Escherichia coli TaxID=562 RepID=UPI00399C1941